MPTIIDDEFGEIIVRKHAKASRISLRIAPDGRLRVSVPTFTPMLAVKAMIKTSRKEIRALVTERQANSRYDKDQPIGKSHSLVVQYHDLPTNIALTGTKIIARISSAESVMNTEIQAEIRKLILKALRKEAKSYLPRRLKYLAEAHGFSYESVKLTHASSRWGSCSSRGTISLNISLMQLPFELLDYVIVHELCHTRQMNHSQDFWSEVSAIDPLYKKHRQELKKYSPNI